MVKNRQQRANVIKVWPPRHALSGSLKLKRQKQCVWGGNKKASEIPTAVGAGSKYAWILTSLLMAQKQIKSGIDMKNCGFLIKGIIVQCFAGLRWLNENGNKWASLIVQSAPIYYSGKFRFSEKATEMTLHIDLTLLSK